MGKARDIKSLNDCATRLTGIEPIDDKEYVRLKWEKPAKKTIVKSGNIFKSTRKRI